MFIGRKQELAELEKLSTTNQAALVVIKGRRRIGKSRLAKEFAKNKKFISFTAIAPIKGISKQDQLDEFARQFYSCFKVPPLTFKDWSDAFLNLSAQLTSEPTIILFDEISWMGSEDPLFVSKIKIWWDNNLSDCKNLTLILCGSISTWIEKNIINSTALFGRIALQITLDDLSILESIALLRSLGVKYSLHEIISILSITGGVPWYIERINPNETAEDNIKRLCFTKNGLLVSEFDRIFHDLFESKSDIYLKIVTSLADGMKTLVDLRKEVGYPDSGSFSEYLKVLVVSGFVSANYQWNLSSSTPSKTSIYRLSDNYLRFYIKYMQKNLHKILKGNFQNVSIYSLPGWDVVNGLQFENLLLKNSSMILEKLGIHNSDVVADNPYIQKPTTQRKGCQVDYLIQTRTKNLYVCEFKFRKNTITSEVIDEVKEKIHRLLAPRGFSVVPVLIYVGELSEKINDADFFYKAIDLGKEIGLSI